VLNSDLNKKVDQFFDEFTHITVGSGLDNLLVETEDLETRVKTAAAEFMTDPALNAAFRAMVSALREDPEPLNLESAIRLFGSQNTAQFLIIHKIGNVVKTKAYARDPKTERIMTPPDMLLKYAIAARAAFGENSRYKITAFAAGIVYDLLLLQIQQNADAKFRKRNGDFLDECFKVAIDRAKLAIRLGRKRKQLTLSKSIPALMLFHELSRVIMSMIFPDYLDLLKASAKNEIPRTVEFFAVQERFGITPHLFGTLITNCFQVMPEISEVLLHWDTPYLLLDRPTPATTKTNEKYDVAAICLLATHLHAEKELPKEFQGLLVVPEYRPELSEFDFSFDPGPILKPPTDSEEEEEEE
jgi:hypothetical protein